MGRLESRWKQVVASKKVQDWLTDEESKVLQLTREDFYEVRQQPERMMPTYSPPTLPKTLNEIGIEPFRNSEGGYILIKRRDTRLPTLYPRLEPPTEQYVGMPFYTLPRFDLLAKSAPDSTSVEDGVNLAWSMGVFQSFLTECFSPFENFEPRGRLKARTKGELNILGQTFPLDAAAEADGYFESDQRIVVLTARESSPESPLSDFSLLQLIPPLVHVSSQFEKPSSGLLLDWAMDSQVDHSTVRFGLYHYDFHSTGPSINPFDYELTKSKSYIILA